MSAATLPLPLQIGTLVIACLAVLTSVIAAYIAFRNNADNAQLAVRLARSEHELEAFDAQSERLQLRFEDFRDQVSTLSCLGGHVGGRTLATRIDSSKNALQLELTALVEQFSERGDSRGVTTVECVSFGIRNVMDLVDNLLGPVVEAEQEGKYRKGFFKDALAAGSEYREGQAQLMARQLDVIDRFDGLMSHRRKLRVDLVADLLRF